MLPNARGPLYSRGGDTQSGAQTADAAMLTDADSDFPGQFLTRQLSDLQSLGDAQLPGSLPGSWEPSAAAQLQALQALASELDGPGDAGAGAGGARPAASEGGAYEPQALSLSPPARARRRPLGASRSFSFPGVHAHGGGGGGADGVDGEMADAADAFDGMEAGEEPRMVPVEAAGEARLSTMADGAGRAAAAEQEPRAARWPGVPPPPGGPAPHGGRFAAAAAARGYRGSVDTGISGAAAPSPAAAAAAVAAMVESMGREQAARAAAREAAAAGAAGGDLDLEQRPPPAPQSAPLPSPQGQGQQQQQQQQPALRDEGSGFSPRALDDLAAFSVSGPPSLLGLGSGGGSGGGGGGSGGGGLGAFALSEAPPALSDGGRDLVLADAGGIARMGSADGGTWAGLGSFEPEEAAAAAFAPGEWRRGGAAADRGEQQPAQRERGLADLQRQLEGLKQQQDEQQQQQERGDEQRRYHLGQLRTASGRLQGWPGALPQAQRDAAAPQTLARGLLHAQQQQQQQQQQQAGQQGLLQQLQRQQAQAASAAAAAAGAAPWQAQPASGDEDAEMELESEAPQQQQQQQQQQQEPGLPPYLASRQRSGGSGLLLSSSSCGAAAAAAAAAGEGATSDGAGLYCLNCTSEVFGSRCDGCGHAGADDVALLQGRLPPVDDGPQARPRQIASRSGAGACAPLLAYDPRLLQHRALRSRSHPERPERASAVMARLAATGLADRCRQVACRPAAPEELAAAHGDALLLEIEGGSARLAAGGAPGGPPASINHGYEAGLPHVLDCYMTPASFACASLAAGSAADVAAAVARGDAPGGAAIIRPPGHHAESNMAMGFCLVNNAAVAARAAQRAGARRVLILDWDVHHGNGTQDIFESDGSVMYMSLHRHDHGNFFPGTGAATEAGTGAGEGLTLNVPWNGPGANDADYIAAFSRVLIPVAYEFAPDLLIVSAGFDAAKGDPLGGCHVSPACFGHLTALLQPIAPLVLLLEGGYNLRATACSVEACVRVLLGEAPPPLPRPAAPTAVGLCGIARALAVHSRYWRCLGAGLLRRGPSMGLLQQGAASPPSRAHSGGSPGAERAGGGGRGAWLPGSPPPSPATDDAAGGLGGGARGDAAGGGDEAAMVIALGDEEDAAAAEAAAAVAAADAGGPGGAAALALAFGPPAPGGGGRGVPPAPLAVPPAPQAERWHMPPSPQLAGLASPPYEGVSAGMPPVLL